MTKLLKPFILICAFVLVTVLPSRGQITAPSATDGNATAMIAAPTGQTPDDVMKKLSDLVHAGKYTEAQQTVAALLILYPDDQRLVKAKALLDKASGAAGAPNVAPTANPPTSNVTSPQTAANLTGMDKVDYNALIELARQAQHNTDLEQQKVSLKQFMDQSTPFLQKHPDEMQVWELRAASAIILGDPMAGYEAGQKLLAMGAADSNDPNLQRLLAQLKNQGWLDKRGAEKAETQEKYDWILGTWSMEWGRGPASMGDYMGVEFSVSDSIAEAHYKPGKGDVRKGDSLRIAILPSGGIHCDIEQRPVLSCEIGDDKRTITIVWIPIGQSDKMIWLLHKN